MKPHVNDENRRWHVKNTARTAGNPALFSVTSAVNFLIVRSTIVR